MAKDCSFDIVSEYDKQEVVNAVEQVKKELLSRFDFKNSNSTVELEQEKSITVTTEDEMKLRNITDIIQSKFSKRGLSQELAKQITSDIKNAKLKVQASIQGEQIRVSGKSKDDLQTVIQLVRGNEDKYNTPLQFTNYR